MPKPPTPAISVSELRRRARGGEIGKAERPKFFEVDEARSKPFSPAILLNAGSVKLPTNAPSLADTTALLNLAFTGEAKAKAAAAAKFKVPIYSEGDSWFNLPDFWVPLRPRYPPDCIDVLDKTFEAKLNNTAIWGDTLKNMTEPANGVKQYVQKLKGGQFRHFLVSGGGNDILENIGQNLLPREGNDTDPANAAKYVRPSFDGRVAKLIRYYETIHSDVKGVKSEIVMYVHGYGNCFPLPDGKYLGNPLKSLGFDPVTVADLARAIVIELLQRFNVALRDFASTHARVVYVDHRSSLTDPADWNWDEIHPSEQGATKVAANFKTVINQNSFLS